MGNNAWYMINKILRIAMKAGEAVLKIYQGQDFSVEMKEDDSPLTSADLAANTIILDQLKQWDIPVVSEESLYAPYEERKKYEQYFLVDPLDGTKEFIKGNGEFTVNIALVKNRVPVLGVIYAPVPDVLYWGSVEEGGSWRLEKASENFDPANPHRKAKKLPCESPENGHLRIVASKTHFSEDTRKYIDNLEFAGKDLKLVARGSSLKLCMVAEGSADLYPRLGSTMEWDIAAGHAIAKYAGCQVTNMETGHEMIYNKEELLNPWFVVKR